MIAAKMKQALVGSLWTVLGRRNLVRLGRFLSMQGRLDVANELSSNGELIVQDIALRHAPPGRAVVFDVGANVGDWTRALLRTAQALGRSVEVHAFEPCSATYQVLQ